MSAAETPPDVALSWTADITTNASATGFETITVSVSCDQQYSSTSQIKKVLTQLADLTPYTPINSYYDLRTYWNLSLSL